MTIEQRALAAYLGLALGDALGATVEFMTPSEIIQTYGVHREIIGGGWLKLAPGAITDDTQMSLALGRSLIRKGGLDPLDLCEEFAAWLRSNPPDVGATCRRGIRRYLADGSIQAQFSEGDAGNGAAMRVFPITLATLGDAAKAREWVTVQARVTHHHPLSDAACQALVEMTQALLLSGGATAARDLAERLLADFPIFQFFPYRGLSSAYVVDTIQTVLHCYFTTDSFEACLIKTVNFGGDADTTGAIAGMLAGATYGLAALPKRWLNRLDQKLVREIERQSRNLLALSSL